MKHRTTILFATAITVCIAGGLTKSFILTAIGCLAGLTFTADLATRYARQATPPAPLPPIAAPSHQPLITNGLLDNTPPPAEPPDDIDPDTGELLGDRVARIEELAGGLERSIEQLGRLLGEQSELFATGLLQVRQRIDHLTPVPEQQTLQQVIPLEKAS